MGPVGWGRVSRVSGLCHTVQCGKCSPYQGGFCDLFFEGAALLARVYRGGVLPLAIT